MALIYTARQRYRARTHDNIPMMAPNDLAYFGGHLHKYLALEGDLYDWFVAEIQKMGWPPVACSSIPGPFTWVLIQ
eukprot:CAMPEP_0197065084 /NCGR_PEP_ID=MMETSP1384-20130603/164317_1 /TAXON_ID=29189 /ORGANISM="Ammonia sp." /LENGTH=75 /DNA_ID=CAMNT_0042501809 /DNA_START=47 /DNA_END=271 /DNA_ORIENTATION=+